MRWKITQTQSARNPGQADRLCAIMNAVQEKTWRSIWLMWTQWVTTTYRRPHTRQTMGGILSPSKTDQSIVALIRTTLQMMKSSKMQERTFTLLQIILTSLSKENIVKSMIFRNSEILLSCSRPHVEWIQWRLGIKLELLSLTDRIINIIKLNHCKTYSSRMREALE